MMPPAKKTAEELLDNLIGAELEALLEADDKDILSEAVDLNIDIASLRSGVVTAVTVAGKRRLAAAKEVVESGPAITGKIIEWPLAKKRELIERVRSETNGLTQAARQGEDETENDLDSLLEDLIEIGVIDDEGNPL